MAHLRISFPQWLALASAVLILANGSPLAAEEAPKSGPQVGENALPYHPLLCTGKNPGQRWCMVCTHRSQGNAMVIVFTRENNEAVYELINSVESLTKKHQKLGGIVTFLTTTGKTAREAEALTGEKVVYINDEEQKQYKALRDLAKSHKILNSNLNIYTTDGPKGYDLSPDAAVTVIVADSNTQVKANMTLRQSELTTERIKKLVSDIERSIPST